jgi:hypothetical protein
MEGGGRSGPSSSCVGVESISFPAGEIYVVNYIVDDWPLAQIRGYSLRLEDFFVKGQGE